jgi:cobalt-precorrin-5B (C1)-methyltransferase
VRELTKRGVIVTISIPGGTELAKMTFNPRLGIEGGLSILGTSGVVRPFSTSALREALECSLSVARACEVRFPAFVPGRIGLRAARRLFRLADEQLIEVGNEWGFMLDLVADMDFDGLLVLGHPGKLAKLADDQWDTHSKRSRSAVPTVARLARQLLGRSIEATPTVEGLLAALADDERRTVADELAWKIGEAIHDRVGGRFPISVVLVNLKGEPLGQDGDLTRWPAKSS